MSYAAPLLRLPLAAATIVPGVPERPVDDPRRPLRAYSIEDSEADAPSEDIDDAIGVGEEPPLAIPAI